MKQDAVLSNTTSSRTGSGKNGSIPADKEAPLGRQKFEKFAFDDTISVTFYGRRLDVWRLVWYRLACFASLGFVFLLTRWLPRFKCWALTVACLLREADYVLVVNSFGQTELVEVQRVQLPDGVTPVSLMFAAEPSPRSPTVLPSPASSSSSSLSLYPSQLAVLDYQCNRFVLDPRDSGTFVSMLEYPSAVPISSLDEAAKGIPLALLERQRTIFGANEIAIQRKTIWQSVADVVLHPFNVFQLAGVVIWSTQEYVLYASVILFLTALSAATSLIENRLTMEKMRRVARFVCPVSVLRGGRWLRLQSDALVPGDLVMLTSDGSFSAEGEVSMMPFDGVLLNGDALVDESLLTGESIPVVKEAVADDGHLQQLLRTTALQCRHTLFAGTRLIRARPRHNRSPVVLVTRTGFSTVKGSLVQAILFPRPNSFRFYHDTMVFIGILSVIAFFGFACSLASLIHLRPGAYFIITRTLDLITVVVPPALHTTMTIGTIFAIQRLKRDHAIYCISPPRINVGARVSSVCFDKTGTLTEEGLDVLGILPTSGQGASCRFAADFLTHHSQLLVLGCNPEAPPLLHAMAACHSLQRVPHGLVGDPLDLKMFAFSGWHFDDARQVPDVNSGILPAIVSGPEGVELGILKTFDFAPTLRRMSVICRRASSYGALSGDALAVMCKGSPESIAPICRPETLPAEYAAALAAYAGQGYRVIACAAKTLTSFSWSRAHTIPRESAESDLVFLGFIVFENKLKRETAPVIAQLHAASIDTAMCTGDNILTAVCVARACGIVAESALIYTPVLSGSPPSLEWECPAEDGMGLLVDFNTLTLRAYNKRPVVLACTGDVLEHLVQTHDSPWLERFFAVCRIYARMSPAQKQVLVELLQRSGKRCVAFCGDGANDCGALRAADVGISLSQAEASVAAPFTSKVADIRCVVNVIREGRASLVTSFSAFKYMALYSMIQFTSLIFLYAYASSLADYQFVYIDLAMVLPLGLLMTRFGTADRLVPVPPTAKLISPSVLVSIIGQTALQAGIQATGYLLTTALEGHEPPKIIPSSPNIESPENTSIFFLSTFLYVTVALLFCGTRPHRRGFYWPFHLWSLFVYCANIYLLFWSMEHWEWLAEEVMQLVEIPDGHRVHLGLLAAVHAVLACVCEWWVFPLVARGVGALLVKEKRLDDGLQSA